MPAEIDDRISYGYWRGDLPKVDGFSHELISSDFKNVEDRTTVDELMALPYEGIDTVYKALQRNLERIPNTNFFGTRVGDKYEWLTVKEVLGMAENLSYGFKALDLIPDIEAEEQSWRFMGIQAKNCKEWGITSFAAMQAKTTIIGMYDTLGPDAVGFIVDQTKLTTISAQAEYIPKLCNLKIEDQSAEEKKMTSLKNLIVFASEISAADKELATQAELNLYTFEEVIFKGREAKKQSDMSVDEPDIDDCIIFSYTSGTTGNPKGVKLTHRMAVTTGYACNIRFSNGAAQFSENDCYISYLPLAHSFEQCIFAISCIYGMKVGFFSGNVLKLTEDMQVLKPTFFPTVPRLLNRIYGKINDGMKAATGIKAWLIKKAVAAKLDNLKTSVYTHGIYDAIIFNKMKFLVGGNLRCIVTGSAPIAGDVLDFLKICFCCRIAEGYGLTETCGGAVVTYGQDSQTGIVGGPVLNAKIKLRDLPEMGYLTTQDPPRGEICFKGPGVMKGYFLNPEKTAEAFIDGWFLSGDVGVIQKNGGLKVIDRAKNIFKLSQGEYIAPEKLENIYVKSGFILQNWMYGDSLKDFIVGILVIDPEAAKKYLDQNKLDLDLETLMSDESFKQVVYDDMMTLANENKLNSLERPKQIVLLKDPFSIENDLLTPTMKLKRNVAKKVFQDRIDKMYSETPMKSKVAKK